MRSYFVKYLRQNILLISQCERFYEANSGKDGKSSSKEKRDKNTFFSEPGRCGLIRFRLYLVWLTGGMSATFVFVSVPSFGVEWDYLLHIGTALRLLRLRRFVLLGLSILLVLVLVGAVHVATLLFTIARNPVLSSTMQAATAYITTDTILGTYPASSEQNDPPSLSERTEHQEQLKCLRVAFAQEWQVG
jgi:hypothetical protein